MLTVFFVSLMLLPTLTSLLCRFFNVSFVYAVDGVPAVVGFTAVVAVTAIVRVPDITITCLLLPRAISSQFLALI